jgi:hypothetical protein
LGRVKLRTQKQKKKKREFRELTIDPWKPEPLSTAKNRF